MRALRAGLTLIVLYGFFAGCYGVLRRYDLADQLACASDMAVGTIGWCHTSRYIWKRRGR